VAGMSKDPRDFAMSFVAASDRYRRQYFERWREVTANFMVDPSTDESGGHRSPTGAFRSPYRRGRSYRNPRNQIILKDPETHKAIMSYASKLVRILFGERDRGYVKARPRGFEDAPQKAPTVSRLLRYDFGLPGHFRTFVESIIDMLMFGTSVVEVNWKYEEREMPVRSVDSQFGVDIDTETRIPIPVYDDVRITPVDVFDFFPDPSNYRISDMTGCAKRFRMNALTAFAEARGGKFDEAKVRRAVGGAGKESTAGEDNRGETSFRKGVDQPEDTGGVSDFREMIGYEYWGDVPWEDNSGVSRRVITVLNNVVVRDDPWPLADPQLPFHTLIINPVQGRFYGVSPAEVVRYVQDFSDAMLVLLAEAVIRQVHPPIAYDLDAEIDVSRLQAWKADALIPARGGPSAVGTLKYDANIQGGFALLGGMKQMIQEASGALGAIQGENGPDREPATVGALRFQSALDRPELAAMVLENECLPPIAEACLRRNQQFLDMEGLKQRVGESPEPVWIGDIMGDFDIEFVGSRVEMSRQEKLQAYDRLISLSAAIPNLAMQIPWDQIAFNLVGDVLELPEVAGRMQDPTILIKNMLLQMASGQQNNGSQNAVSPSSQQAGLPTSQASGSPIGG